MIAGHQKGTNLFGRAKPQPDMVSLGQLFEDDFQLRAVPTRSWVIVYPVIMIMKTVCRIDSKKKFNSQATILKITFLRDAMGGDHKKKYQTK